MEFVRHGDVLLKPVKKSPCKMTKKKEIILAEGEITGHFHRLKGEGIKEGTKNNVMYVSISVPTPLTHEEHGTITVPPGDYERVFEREYDYALEDITKVVD